MTHLDIQARTVATGTGTGTGVDISGITGDWTLVLEVMGLNSGDTLRMQFTDSADNFSSDIVAGPTASVTGQIGSDGTSPFTPGNPPTGFEPNVKRYTWNKRDFPDLRMGTTSAKLRFDITTFSGSSKSVVTHSWVEY